MNSRTCFVWGQQTCAIFALICCLFSYTICRGQHSGPASPSKRGDEIRTLTLEYDDPITYALGSKTAAITADFKSGSDGSIFIEMVSLEGPRKGFHIFALKPSGDVVQFTDPEVDGLRNFAIPMSYFVTDSKTYALRRAEVFDPSLQVQSSEPAYVVVVYDTTKAQS